MKPGFFLAALALWCLSTGVRADELSICYNYECASRATVYLRGAELSRIRMHFSWVQDAEDERSAIARAIGQFIAFAGQQTPTFRDHGRNVADEGVDGRMDCIDHAHNTTLYLRLMEERGWLKFHQVLGPVKRAPLIVNEHWAALIAEREDGRESMPESATANAPNFVIDSWFLEPGQPAAIFTLEEWKNGAEPNE